MPKSSKRMGKTGRLILAQKINAEYMSDGFFGLVVQGKQRIGKSSYTQQCLAESCGKWEKMYVKALNRESMVCVERDYEAVKKRVVFKPEEFLDLTLLVDVKSRAVIWDDAGYCLFSCARELSWVCAFCRLFQFEFHFP